MQKDPSSLKTHKTPSWEGKLDRDILEKNRGQSPALFAALQNRARQLGHDVTQLCEHLGFSYPYFNQLNTGRRSIPLASVEFTQACARYLGVPRTTVLALAGALSPEDLYEDPSELAYSLPRAFEFVCQDAEWLPFYGPNTSCATPELQYIIVRLYEKANNVVLLPERLNLQRLGDSMNALRQIKKTILSETEPEGYSPLSDASSPTREA